MRVVIVSLGTARQEQVLADAAAVVEAGGSVELLVTKVEPWDGLPEGVRTHAVGTVEAKHPLLRVERTIVLRLPRVIYRIGAKVVSLLARILPGRLGRMADGLGRRWKGAWLATKARTTRFHKERFGGWYARVRPWVLWRAARRRVVPRLELDRHPPDLIIVADGLSTPIGWHLARRYPAAGVGFSLADASEDRERYGVAVGASNRS